MFLFIEDLFETECVSKLDFFFSCQARAPHLKWAGMIIAVIPYRTSLCAAFPALPHE